MAVILVIWRLPRMGFILGRAGVLGHLSKLDLWPTWLANLFKLLNFLIVSRSARTDAGQALCEALQILGPGFIKFGQALATRADLIGPELAGGLVQLQDKLPAFSGRLARQIIEDSAGKSVEKLFSSFDDIPVAAASIAQVHKARLPDGRLVAVKILRPDIHKRMRRDIRFFKAMARLVETLAPALRRLRLVTAVDQFESISEIELDLRMEAAAGGKLSENLKADNGIRIPFIDLERTSSSVLVTEWVDGVRIDDIDALDAAGCRGFNVQNVNGRGQQQGVEVFTGRGATTATRTSLPKAMITTVVQDSDKEKIIDVILGSAKSSEEGAIGDGKIFISPVSEVIRVRTGERDESAL